MLNYSRLLKKEPQKGTVGAPDAQKRVPPPPLQPQRHNFSVLHLDLILIPSLPLQHLGKLQLVPQRLEVKLQSKSVHCFCPVCPPGPLLDRLRGPGRSAGRGVSQEPQQPVQSQGGGDEGRGTPVLPGRPGHLAQSPHGLPALAVKVSP